MFKNILVAVDVNDSSSWEKALPVAVEYAQKFEAVLNVVTVVPDFGMSIVGQYFPEGFEHKALEQAREKLHEFVSEHVPEGVTVRHIVEHGTVYEEIIDAAKKVDADLIVMASHRPSLRDHIIGPNAIEVITHCRRSVLVVRN